MKKILKNRLFLVILTFIVSVSISVVAANISATDVSYNGMTVQEALDNLYTNGGGATPSTIITGLDVSATVKGTTINVTSTATATDNSKIMGYHYILIDKDNNQKIYDIMSTNNNVTFRNLDSYTKYLYYCVAYDVNNNSIKSVTNEVETEDLAIVFNDKYDKYVYIDSNIGNDTTGDGTKSNPYKTLDKIASTGIIVNNYSYGIILNSGTYELTYKIFELSNNKSINIIGNRQNTILSVVGLYVNKGGGSKNYTVNLYRLVWDGTPTGANVISLNTPFNLYNVAIKLNYNDVMASYFNSQGSYTFNNCTLSENKTNVFRTTAGTIKLTNCYGGFSSGYATQQSNWDYQTNTITSTPQVDSLYRITDSDETWLGNGTGTNPDGSQANRGVYGGAYSWDVKDDLF